MNIFRRYLMWNVNLLKPIRISWFDWLIIELYRRGGCLWGILPTTVPRKTWRNCLGSLVSVIQGDNNRCLSVTGTSVLLDLYCGTSILLEGFQTVCLVNPGLIAEVHLSIDTVTKKIRGYAFILFMMPEHAVRAYAELDGTIFMVR